MVTYHDKHSGVTRSFELTDDELVVRGRRMLGTGFELRYPLNELSPVYDKLWARDSDITLNSGVLIALAALWPMLYLKFFIGRFGDLHLGYMWIPPIVVGFLLAVVHYARRPVEFAQLRWRGGPAAVAIAQVGKDRSAFDDFLAHVQAALLRNAAPN